MTSSATTRTARRANAVLRPLPLCPVAVGRPPRRDAHRHRQGGQPVHLLRRHARTLDSARHRLRLLADGSQKVASTETAQHGRTNVKTLIDDPASGPTKPWTASSLDTALGAAPANVLSLNAHYDHYRLLPSDRGTLFSSSQMAAKSLTGRFVFTMGCHAGLSVSDIIVGASDSRHLDWAQVYGAGGALFAGNTGFGYGDTTGVAYSEKLMALLAKRLDGSLSAGDALTFAKNDFKASLGPIDVYDEKVISETTFYGLPMYRVGPAAALPPVPAPRPTAPDPTVGGGVLTADLSVSPTLTPRTSPFGSYFSSDDTVSTSYRPVEPSTSTDVTSRTSSPTARS